MKGKGARPFRSQWVSTARDSGIGRIFVGRTREVALLQELISEREAGGYRRLLLCGPAGIGKSELCRQVAAEVAPGETELLFEYKCPQSGAHPYLVLGALVDRLLECHRDNLDSYVALARDPAVLVPAARGILLRISTLLRSVDGNQDDAPHAQPERSQSNVSEELARFVLRLFTDCRTVFLCIDDLQWMDEQSLAVLTELLRREPDNVRVLLIGRPEAPARLAAELQDPSVELAGLSEAESVELVHMLAAAGEASPDTVSAALIIHRRVHGNPLGIIQIARDLSREGPSDPGADPSQERDGSRQNPAVQPEHLQHGSREEQWLEGLARTRTAALSDHARALAHVLALLGSPVSLDRLEAPELRRLLSDGVEAALHQAVERGLVRRDADGLSLSHDTVEQGVLRGAIEDQPVVEAVVTLLFRESQQGDDSSLFGLAELIAPEDTGRRAPLSAEHLRRAITPDQVAAVLERAAERAELLLSSQRALRYADAALRLSHQRVDPDRRLRLHQIAHEAAYYLRDMRGMSRHFQSIRSLGDVVTANEARRLWITANFARSRFAEAIRIARLALAELGVRLPSSADDPALAAARRYVTRRSVRLLRWRLRRLAASGNRQANLIVSICGRLFITIFAAAPELIPFMIRTIVTLTLRHGRAPESGIAFIYWALLAGATDSAGVRLYRRGQAARELMGAETSEFTRVTTEIATCLMCEHWGRPYAAVYGELATLRFDAARLGNTEWAAHAEHVYSVGHLITGKPLAEARAVLAAARRRIEELGVRRTARAVAKYEQAAECLLGLTDDPIELRGDIVDSDAELEAVLSEGDYAAALGLRYVRGMLLLYGDCPERGLAEFREAMRLARYAGALPDIPFTNFMSGMCAFRLGKREEALQALRKQRPWARGAPANQAHRYLALQAERCRRRGERSRAAVLRRTAPFQWIAPLWFRRAAALYERGLNHAVRYGYLHEAALLSERLGDLLSYNPRHRASAMRLFHEAASLYEEWGAVGAASRVRYRFSDAPQPPSAASADLRFVSRLAAAQDPETVLQESITALFRTASSSAAYLRAAYGGEQVLYRATGGDRVARIDADQLPHAVAKLWSDDARGQRVTDTGRVIGLHAATGSLRTRVTLRGALLQTSEQPGLGRGALDGLDAIVAASALAFGRTLLDADVGERELELQTTREVLHSNRRNQDTLFATVRDGMVLLGRGNALLYYNPAARRYVVERAHYAELDGELLAAVERLRAVQSQEHPGSSELPWRDRTLRLSVSAAGDTTAVVVQDVTEVLAQEEQIRRQQQQLILADRMSSLGMLSATIGHEVGNPNYIVQLNAESLRLQLQRLAEQAPAELGRELAQAEQFADQISQGTGRIETVISRIKEYGRSGRSEEWQWVSPNAVCDSAIRFSRILVVQYTDAFRFRPGGDLPQIWALPGLLEQAIVNLIKNACEVLPNRRAAIVLETGRAPDRSSVRIAVADQGPGIDDAVKASVGRAFLRGRNPAGGTGLGLSIVQTILERHKGTLSFESSEEFATIAVMTLPTGSRLDGQHEAPPQG
jgi:signal transduction histidine kinase/predicted ATPase